uniref:Putative secreted protein n=1 Tax=Ixodes ricinus TaxID=34613 RepID=A0A6B0TU22_IXORI
MGTCFFFFLSLAVGSWCNDCMLEAVSCAAVFSNPGGRRFFGAELHSSGSQWTLCRIGKHRKECRERRYACWHPQV